MLFPALSELLFLSNCYLNVCPPFTLFQENTGFWGGSRTPLTFHSDKPATEPPWDRAPFVGESPTL